MGTLPENFGLDLSGRNPGAAGGKGYSDQIVKWQRENPFQPKQHNWGKNWTKEEYDKHLAEVHAKYPGMTQLYLHGGADQNANLSSHKNTDKYARLADAYNATYRYTPGQWSGGGWDSIGSYTPGKWENVAHLETQDQREMDQLREAQGDLRHYGLDTEKHYQQQYLEQKMQEAMKLTNQGYEEAFFNSNEEMRRTKELFDMFRQMSEQEFITVMKEYRMPAAQASRMYEMIKDGRLFEAMLFGEKLGLSPQTADQVTLAIEGGRIIKDLCSGAQGHEQIQARLGTMKGQALLGQIEGIYNAAVMNKGSLSPEMRMTAETLRTAIHQANKLGYEVLEHSELILGAAGLAWALGQALGVAGALFK